MRIGQTREKSHPGNSFMSFALVLFALVELEFRETEFNNSPLLRHWNKNKKFIDQVPGKIFVNENFYRIHDIDKLLENKVITVIIDFATP